VKEKESAIVGESAGWEGGTMMKDGESVHLPVFEAGRMKKLKKKKNKRVRREERGDSRSRRR